jgi:hypothetical protein
VSDWFDGGGGTPCDVPALLDGTGVLEALTRIVSLGALVSLGCTSDGGALGVTVTVDGRWRREYFREADPLVHWTAAALEAVEGALGSSAPASSVPRQRQRTRKRL